MGVKILAVQVLQEMQYQHTLADKQKMSHLMTKPTKWHNQQTWAFAQSDQSLCFALNG